MASNKSSGALDQVVRYTGSRFTRHDFPEDFTFGAATSAYQVEGAFNQDGRSLCNWDAFTLRTPGRILDGSNATYSIDHYNRMKEDVKLMKKVGLDAYRFSLAWSRILPGGRLSSGVNRDGVKFYNDLIDLLLAEGIEPYVTLFHFDVPLCLEEEYGGFLSERSVQDFAEYADVCFFEFGDRVKEWATMNEQWSFTHHGYVNGNFPPGHGSTTPLTPLQRSSSHLTLRPRSVRVVNPSSEAGDPTTEPYIVAHNLILAHAVAVDIYRRNYKAVQGGQIGVVNMTTWYEPLNPDDQDDIVAAARAVDFMWGWFVAPIVTGDYPPVMRRFVGNRLPRFTPAQKLLVQGSYDFLGVNYYTTNYAANNPNPTDPPGYAADQQVKFAFDRDGVPIGEQAGSPWLFIVPRGIYHLLMHTKNTYNDPVMYIMENGVDEVNNRHLPLHEARKDDYRIQYHLDHFAYIKKAIDEGADLKGYFLWSLFDNYEWTEGYTVRFGMFFVDYDNGFLRYPKTSAIWYMNVLNKDLLTNSKREVEEVEEVVSVKRKRGVKA